MHETSFHRRWRLTLALVLVIAACGEAEPDPRPNLVLIIGDDHGYPDFGFMGSPHVETPVLDRLASEGTLFVNGYTTSSICGPTLRSLLTGRHPVQRNDTRSPAKWVRRQRRSPTLQHVNTLPRLLSQHGYATFQAGKLPVPDFADAGFDDSAQRSSQTRGMDDGGLGRGAMDPVHRFLDAQDDGPFLLWFAPLLPHLPHDAPAELRARYEQKGLSVSAILYYANITRFDMLVGELLLALEVRGLSERTLIVYLADNGWDQRWNVDPKEYLAGGLRGKHSIYDLGFRTPIILHAPGLVPAGEVRDELVSIVDLLPTLLDFAGAPIPNDLPGHSLRPFLRGGVWPRNDVIGWTEIARVDHGVARPPKRAGAREIGPAWFLRSGDWHYVWFDRWGGELLFDVRADPREENDVAAQSSDLTTRFRRRIKAWRKQLDEP